MNKFIAIILFFYATVFSATKAEYDTLISQSSDPNVVSEICIQAGNDFFNQHKNTDAKGYYQQAIAGGIEEDVWLARYKIAQIDSNWPEVERLISDINCPTGMRKWGWSTLARKAMLESRYDDVITYCNKSDATLDYMAVLKANALFFKGQIAEANSVLNTIPPEAEATTLRHAARLRLKLTDWMKDVTSENLEQYRQLLLTAPADKVAATLMEKAKKYYRGQAYGDTLVIVTFLETLPETIDTIRACEYKANCLYMTGKHLEAAAAYENLLTKWPNNDHSNWNNQFMVGRSYEAAGDKVQAKEAFQKVVDNHSDSPAKKAAEDSLRKINR